MAGKKKPKRARTQAQIDSEQRRQELYGKTMVRHNEASRAAVTKVMKRDGLSASGAFVAAILAYAKRNP